MATLMVTGHRQIVPEGHTGNLWPDSNPVVFQHHQLLTQHLTYICYELFLQGYTNFISGYALGADQLFAESVIELKRLSYPVRLVAAVPFKSQCSNWPQKSQIKYRELLGKADEVVIVSPGEYSSAKMQKRNEWMVDRADLVLAVWNGAQSGGTFNCVKYALGQGKKIIKFHPEKLVAY